jgi:DNA-binding transcriptional LysR family regulator
MRFGNLNLRSIDLNLLVALQALLEDRSVTRAAHRLGVSQPALSRMLARLRAILDDPLLVRSGREMVPTPRAMELVGPLEAWLSDAAGPLTPATFEPASADGVIRIMATDDATEAVVTPLICDLARDAPGLRFELSALKSPVSAALTRGDADYALDTFPESLPGCHVQHLFDDSFVCLVRTGHPTVRGSMSTRD